MTPDERKKLRELAHRTWTDEEAHFVITSLPFLLDYIDTLEAAVAVKDEALTKALSHLKWGIGYSDDVTRDHEICVKALTPNAGAELLSELRRLREENQAVADIIKASNCKHYCDCPSKAERVELYGPDWKCGWCRLNDIRAELASLKSGERG